MKNAESVLSLLIPCQPKLDLSGKKFNRLTALKCLGKRARNRFAYWEFLCDCGNTTIACGSAVHLGQTKSCGCLRVSKAKVMGAANLLHGHSSIPRGITSATYRSWSSMKARCLNPKATGYRLWGGRGISIDPRWMEFSVFLEDMGARPSVRYSLDRWPNKDGNYCKQNCRWALVSQQQNNRRNNLMVSITGNSMSVSQMCRILGGNRHTGANAYHAALAKGQRHFIWNGTVINIPPKS